jgi:D-glycero-alpha-D-manno-heptose-7-phosphate kinase
MTTAKAWCRVDLAGGTLDIWPLGLFHPQARTINVAIDLAVTVGLRPRPEGYRVLQGESVVEARSAGELARQPAAALIGVAAAALDLPPFEAVLASESPRGGGLGASSAMTVAFLAAAEEARLMGLPTGMQDHYPALLGGALEIRPVPGGERVRRLDVDLEALASSLLVVYSGQSHFSAGNNWQVVRRRLEAEPEVTGLFEGIAATAAELAPALEAGNLPRVGELMSHEWSDRRRLAEGISTPVLEELLRAAAAAGAWGGKACGAGGGGCLAILGPPERKGAIAAALEGAGGKVLNARPTGLGLQISSD